MKATAFTGLTAAWARTEDSIVEGGGEERMAKRLRGAGGGCGVWWVTD